MVISFRVWHMVYIKCGKLVDDTNDGKAVKNVQ